MKVHNPHLYSITLPALPPLMRWSVKGDRKVREAGYPATMLSPGENEVSDAYAVRLSLLEVSKKLGLAFGETIQEELDSEFITEVP